jgi:hypothetical protein
VPIGRLFSRLLLLIALAAQGYLAQSHLHDDGQLDGVAPTPVVASYGHDDARREVSVSAPAQHAAEHDAEACTLCQLIALSEHVAMPNEESAEPPLAGMLDWVVASHITPARGALSHSWQSRAPPSA